MVVNLEHRWRRTYDQGAVSGGRPFGHGRTIGYLLSIRKLQLSHCDKVKLT